VPFGNYVNYHGGKLLDWYGRERVKRMFACRSFLDTGVAVAGSSDYPCSPFEVMEAIQSCVTRRGWDGPLIGENQRISTREAPRAIHHERRIRDRRREPQGTARARIPCGLRRA
jgi:predicted amidohydrolase YtcJ